MARIFVTRELPGPALARLKDNHETTVWPEPLPPSYEQLREHAAHSHALLSMLTDRVDAELIAAAPNLRVVANYAVGYDNIDIEAATARGIQVGNTPDALTEATADLAFALLMAAARRIPEAAAFAHNGEWRTWDPGAFLGADISGATLGIIGLGRIGQAVARRAAGFGMEVLTTETRDQSNLEHLLRRSDFVTVHLPLTPGTRKLIGAEAFALMKPTAILINTARGAIVDKAALAEALHTGQIGGAALDVTEPEPLPADDPLWQAPNLLVVPHIGSATWTARERMAEIAVENILAGLEGKHLPYQVPAQVFD
ncbi:MAG TPA: D-glycerate dehydrogenase [Solirubrobacteraceae bacterium]|jgi:glyoxylate reductase|nr:D-glycerate dehydrogenase [Solirubrobacteraceae bacterium]